MAQLRRSLTVFLFGIFIGCGCLKAAAENANENIQIKFRTLGYQSSPQGLFYNSVGEPVEITVPQSFWSKEYAYLGPSTLTFYRPAEVAGAEPEIIDSVELSGDVKEWLLLFTQQPSTGEIRIYAMDVSLEGFPYGSSWYFNLTDRTLGVVYGERKFRLDPKTSEKVSPDIEPNQNVQLQILAIRNEKLQDIYNSQWPQESNVRYLIFIVESLRRRERVEIFSVADYQPAVDE